MYTHTQTCVCVCVNTLEELDYFNTGGFSQMTKHCLNLYLHKTKYTKRKQPETVHVKYTIRKSVFLPGNIRSPCRKLGVTRIKTGCFQLILFRWSVLTCPNLNFPCPDKHCPVSVFVDIVSSTVWLKARERRLQVRDQKSNRVADYKYGCGMW